MVVDNDDNMMERLSSVFSIAAAAATAEIK